MRLFYNFILCLIGAIFSYQLHAAPTLNKELEALYLADQTERESGTFNPYDDENRLEKAIKIINRTELNHYRDYFHIAILYQHGRLPEHFKQAQRYALQSMKLNPEFKLAKWLASAAEDRYLLSIGKEQVWGTQFRGFGCVDSAPFNKNAKTDQQRIERGVPTLAEINQYLNDQKDCEPIE